MIKEEGSKFNVYDSTGSKLLGSHGSRAEAVNQIQAIEASKHDRDKHGRREEWKRYGDKK